MALDLKRTARLYRKLLRIAPELRQMTGIFKASGRIFGDLHLKVLERSDNFMRIALTQYWNHPSGQLIPDPELVIAVYFDVELAEALTYHDAEHYDVAYPQDGEPPDFWTHDLINVFLEEHLDKLYTWQFLLDRDHQPKERMKHAARSHRI